MMKKWKESVGNMSQFSNRPNVNKVAVENFLIGIGAGNVPSNIERLVSDAKTYKWNNETIEAIIDGILRSNELEIGDIEYVGNVRQGGKD
jgi:hypothetical protein